MRRQAVLMLKVGAKPVDQAQPKSAELAKYQQALAVLTQPPLIPALPEFEGTDLESFMPSFAEMASALSYQATPILIIDPLLSYKKFFDLSGSAPASTDAIEEEKEPCVIGLAELDDQQLANQMKEIYKKIGMGVTVCFATNSPENTVGEQAPFTTNSDLLGTHFESLKKFNDWIFQQGGVEAVTEDSLKKAMAKGSTFSGLPGVNLFTGAQFRNGPLHDLDQSIADAFLEGQQLKKEHDSAKTKLTQIADQLKADLVAEMVSSGDKTAMSAALKALVDGTLKPFLEEPVSAAGTATLNEIGGVLGADGALETFKSDHAQEIANIRKVSEHIRKTIALGDKIHAFLSNFEAGNVADPKWSKVQGEIAEALKLIDNAKALPSSQTKEVATVLRSLEVKIQQQNAIITEKVDLIAAAATTTEYEAAAKKAQQEESATDHLLKAGFYSKDKDLSHVFAEKGLEAFKGIVDPATQSQYAGAFILPGVGDTTGASLNRLAEALTAAKQKIDAAEGSKDKITLPITLRFLMHAPGNPGHETVLDVFVAAGAGNKVVTVTQFDSLLPETKTALPVDSLLPETKTALPAALLTTITTAFGAGYNVNQTISQNPNPIGQQAGVECVYFAVAEIAKGYSTTLASITSLADAAGKANMKLAVTKLMADAVQSEYMLADDRKAALSEPPKTVCVNPGDLRLATEGDAKKYNTVPGLENLKAGDIIYPVVLENKRLAYEINQRAAAAKGGVKALQADMAFITLCRELIQNNTPSEPDLNGLNDVAQRVLVELIVMNAHRQAITTAVPQAGGTITTADRANVQDQVKSAVTPFDLENKALEALKKGEAGRELLKGFSSVVKAAQEDCQKRLATLASTKGDADKKESAADSKKAKTTTTTEGGDAFKNLDEAARKKVMSSLCGEMKETFKLPPRSQFQKVEFEVVKQTNKQTGKQEDQISVVKTADTDECRVTLSVTVTKIGKTQAEKPVDVTLVRTVTDEKVERKCETTSDLVDWKTQCALMAAASISDRKKAAELQSTPDKKVEPDLNIRVSIVDNSPQVKDQLIGGKSTDKLTRDEAIMIQAYLDAGYTRVQCQGMDFYPAGTTKASSYAVAEAKLSPVLSAGGDPDHKLPNVAATAPTKEERPQDKKGLFLDIVIPFRNKATPQGLDNVQQARAILKNARELHGKGYRFVGITYSANQAETAAIRAAYDKKPTPVDITGATKGGANQAEVMVEVERLLAKSRASGGYDDLQGIFRIVPITTMSAGGAAPVTGDHDTAASLEAAKAFVQEGGALLGWQNQNGASRGVYAVGGGVATKAFASAEGDAPEIAASKKALEEAYGVRQKMIQSALANLKKEYSPVSSETATATL